MGSVFLSQSSSNNLLEARRVRVLEEGLTSLPMTKQRGWKWRGGKHGLESSVNILCHCSEALLLCSTRFLGFMRSGGLAEAQSS